MLLFFFIYSFPLLLFKYIYFGTKLIYYALIMYLGVCSSERFLFII